MKRHRRALAILIVAATGGCRTVPTQQDPHVVTLDGALSNRFVHAGERTALVARVRIGTRPVPRAQRPPVNLALVVDTSGSMTGKPIEDARTASLSLVDALSLGDRLAVVAFHSRTEVLVESTVLNESSRAEIRRKVGAMSAQGTTDMAGGLRAALLEVYRNLDADGINRVVLLGDGVPNDPAPIAPLAREASERGVTITALGLGLDYDETLMGNIAQLSGGRFHYIDDSTKVAVVFREELLRLRRVVGRNAVVTITPGPGVEIASIVGLPAGRIGSSMQVPVGDLSDGDQRELIVRLQAPGRRAGAAVELLDGKLSFEDGVAAAGRIERTVYLGARATADSAEFLSGRNEEVERAAARVQAAAGTVEAIRIARMGDYRRAQEHLDRIQSEARASARSMSDVALEEQAAAMTRLREALPSLAVAAPVAVTAGSASIQLSSTESESAPARAGQAASTVREYHDSALRTVIGY